MTKNELKIEIQNIIYEMPEEVLEDILIYLKEIKDLSQSDLILEYNLSKIIREDKKLHEKLAEN